MPAGSEEVVLAGGPGVTVSDNSLVALRPPLSCTLAVNANVPLFSGVPLMVPLLLSPSPTGSAPCDTDQM